MSLWITHTRKTCVAVSCVAHTLIRLLVEESMDVFTTRELPVVQLLKNHRP